ncbi:HAMP domain-containing sensor histidine kinase [Ferviditalea candida]|uniref:histidine kinase n=1 Tax=Ferviditalea candida TaxID=3108399 RepID=A0ABU5ZCS8_9BACL|nr:HAMP domain-containing sensor histidine kinase [Paenibacillaceae bacterium T2]
MFTKSNRRQTLLRYWTSRYLLILCIGLILIGVVSYEWITFSANEKRLEIVKWFAYEIADQVVDDNGQLNADFKLPRDLETRERLFDLKGRPVILVFDRSQSLVSKLPGQFPASEWIRQISGSLKDAKNDGQIQTGRGPQFSYVKQPIQYKQQTVGWVVIVYSQENLVKDREGIEFLLVMLSGIAFLGWAVIYLLTKKLSAPVKEVARAAKQIVAGNYDIHFDKKIKEKEIYDLTESFKNMADRLRQSEMMRTELLAGVTHELKTPVASIGGLIQAVNDEVVTGKEAREFLEISINETNKLQKMIEDLLDYNSFVVGAMKVHKQETNMNNLIQEIVYQWKIAQEQGTVRVNTHLPQTPILYSTDPVRIQQILYNLLNNAKQSFEAAGQIDVTLAETADGMRIDIKDNGPGIAAEEKDIIFERFYRGQNKKNKVRGLGLGLPFSKVIAKSLGGDVYLAESSSGGSTFTLQLTRQDELRLNSLSEFECC